MQAACEGRTPVLASFFGRRRRSPNSWRSWRDLLYAPSLAQPVLPYRALSVSVLDVAPPHLLSFAVPHIGRSLRGSYNLLWLYSPQPFRGMINHSTGMMPTWAGEPNAAGHHADILASNATKMHAGGDHDASLQPSTHKWSPPASADLPGPSGLNYSHDHCITPHSPFRPTFAPFRWSKRTPIDVSL